MRNEERNEEIGKEPIDHWLASNAAYANVSKEMAPSVQSTGFRTSALLYSTLSQSNDGRIAEDFLINSRLVRQDRESEVSVTSYFSDATMTMLSMLGQGEDSALPVLSLP